MSVSEILDQLPVLTAAERLQLQDALSRLDCLANADAAELARRRSIALDKLRDGWCSGGGRSLAEGIDDAVYGGER